MEAFSERTRQVRLALMLIIGVAAAAACVVALMLWKALLFEVHRVRSQASDLPGAAASQPAVRSFSP